MVIWRGEFALGGGFGIECLCQERGWGGGICARREHVRGEDLCQEGGLGGGISARRGHMQGVNLCQDGVLGGFVLGRGFGEKICARRWNLC